jgi:hypothetical protein
MAWLIFSKIGLSYKNFIASNINMSMNNAELAELNNAICRKHKCSKLKGCIVSNSTS